MPHLMGYTSIQSGIGIFQNALKMADWTLPKALHFSFPPKEFLHLGMVWSPTQLRLVVEQDTFSWIVRVLVEFFNTFFEKFLPVSIAEIDGRSRHFKVP